MTSLIKPLAILTRLLPCFVSVCPTAGLATEALTQIAEVRSLTSEEAGRSIPVLLRGVMTTPGGISFAIQDELNGVWINVFESRRRGYWKGDDAVFAAASEGMEVEITGITDAGGYAPGILPETMKVLGPKPMPAARPIPLCLHDFSAALTIVCGSRPVARFSERFSVKSSGSYGSMRTLGVSEPWFLASCHRPLKI